MNGNDADIILLVRKINPGSVFLGWWRRCRGGG